MSEEVVHERTGDEEWDFLFGSRFVESSLDYFLITRVIMRGGTPTQLYR